jgi:maltooligosyltrehalose synthase
VIVAVPRLVATVTPHVDVPPLGERAWGDTHLIVPPGPGPSGFHNVLTDRCMPAEETGAIRVADLFECFPVAVLIG